LEFEPVWSRFAPRLRKTVLTSLELAARHGLDEALPDHLLLTISRDEAAAGAFLLDHAGIALEVIAKSVEARFPFVPTSPSRWRAQHLSKGTLETLAIATREAETLGDAHVGTEHVMLALTMVGGAATDLLREAGFGRAHALAGRRAWLDQGMPRHKLPRYRGTLLAPLHRLKRLSVLLHAVYFHHSLAHPQFISDPYRLYRRLREREPVRRDPVAPVWVVTGFDETMTVLRDPRFRKDPYLSDALPDPVRRQLRLPGDPDATVEGEPMAMLFIDPPRHTRIRAAFNRSFTSKSIELLRPRIQRITDALIDQVQPVGRMDAIKDLAVPLPLAVIAELLGFPAGDLDRLKRWSDDFAAALTISPTPAQVARSNQSRQELRAYFDEFVARFAEQPGENLISALLAECVDLDDACARAPGKLSRAELFANCALLLAAGHETTTNLIGNGLLALLRHPDQLALLRDDPSLIGSAVEELLRYDSPVQWTSRVAVEDVQLSGQTIARGDVVLASLGAANRDPKHFRDPERLDIRRADNKHLAFGQGIHYCLGAALARVEAEVAIGTALKRLPKLRLRRRRLKWQRGLIFRGVRTLPVMWEQAAGNAQP
jgi:cytochrome P450